jgi:hypothetical protein
MWDPRRLTNLWAFTAQGQTSLFSLKKSHVLLNFTHRCEDNSDVMDLSEIPYEGVDEVAYFRGPTF